MNSRAVFQSKPHLLLGCLVTGFAGASSQATVPVEEFELAPFRVIGDVLDSREIVPSRLFESPLGGTDSVLEMPRSVTLVSPEQLAVFGVRNYEDMQGLSSSLFSSSIFGISGTPDIRGAIAETYYRGMKRADNRGIFPQPIGAAQRLEIIKGPPSPLHGAGALGGYVNFVPKTARAEEGGYLESHEGLLTLQVGSYNQRIADLEFGGPLSLPNGQPAGFYLYGSYEDSDSFYHDSFDRFAILQGTVSVTLSSAFRFELGGQFQHWRGTEIAGINRIDQTLIDDGLYQTGQAFSTDVNGDSLDQGANGRLSANEVIRALSLPVAGDDPLSNPIIRWNSIDPATDRGQVKVDRRRTIIDPGDSAYADSWLGFVDLFYTPNEQFELKNQLFFDGYESGKDTTQGFNGRADVHVLENRTTAQWNVDLSDELRLTQHVIASVRHQDVDRAWALDLQNFNRRDVMTGPSIADQFHRTSEGGSTAYPFNQRWQSRYTAYSPGVVTALEWRQRHTLTLGGRYDYYTIDQGYTARPDLFPGTEYFSLLQLFYGNGGILDYDPVAQTPTDFQETRRQSGSDHAFSTHLSFLSKITPGLSAYVTFARQSDVRRGDAGEYPQVIPDPEEAAPLPLRGHFLAESTMMEAGLKGLWLNDRLFAGLSLYQLDRTSSNPRAVTTNDYRNEGLEIEIRWAATRNLSLFANANWQRSEYLQDYRNQLEEGFFFISHPAFAGIPITAEGGLLDSSYDTGLAFDDSAYADLDPNRRRAIPNAVVSLGGTYMTKFFGFATYATYYGESGVARPWFVTLPDYIVVNGSIFLRWESWFVNLRVKNAFDQDYWQNTDPDYLGGGTVIAMPGRTWELAVSRRF